MPRIDWHTTTCPGCGADVRPGSLYGHLLQVLGIIMPGRELRAPGKNGARMMANWELQRRLREHIPRSP